jgi:hypothetical protein
MVGRMDIARTCCHACATVSEGFNGAAASWERIAGTWTEAGGLLETVHANAVILYPAGGPDEWYGNFECEIRRPNRLPKSAHRFVFGWTDADNYWYVEFQATGGFGSAETRTITISRVVDGAGSALAAKTLEGESAAFDRLVICLQSGVVQARGGPLAGDEYLFVQAAVDAGGGRFGLGSGAFVHGNPVEFDNFVLDYKTGESDEVCEQCPNGICCEGYAIPETLSVTLTGFPAPYNVWNAGYLVPIRGYRTLINRDACWWRVENVLANPNPAYPPKLSRIEVMRSNESSHVEIRLRYEWLFGPGPVEFVGVADWNPDDPWDVSPCKNKWATPTRFSGAAEGGQASVSGNL